MFPDNGFSDGLVADLGEQALQVLAHRLVDLVVGDHDADLLAGGAGLLHQLTSPCRGPVRCQVSPPPLV